MYEETAVDYAPTVAAGSDWTPLFLTVGLLVFLAVVLIVTVTIIRRLYRKGQHLQHVVFLVRLPKERVDDEEGLKGKELLYANIAKAETILEAVGGLRAVNGWSAWLKGRSDVFSFEIVASRGLINFYLAAPIYAADFIVKQVHAHFPEAQVEAVKDYNMFSSTSHISAGYLMTTNNFVLPFKTYRQDDVDSLNSVLNVMSKLQPEEAMAMQLIACSAHKSWHREVAAVVRKAYKHNNLNQALKHNKVFAAINFVLDMFSSKPPEVGQPQRQLTAMEQQVLKGIEEKNAKAGLDVNLRLVVASPSIERAEHYLADAVASFSQFNYFEYGNGFNNTALRRHEHELIADFIHRRFDARYRFLLNTEEAASLFHFPLPTAETPNIEWLSAKSAAAPVNTPREGLVLGYNDYRGQSQEIRIKAADRLRHVYMIGKSGVGKSFLLANMAIQDILNGDGICVLDPHGDLIDDILERVPPERAKDVIIFSPADIERPLGLNLLEYDPRYPEQKSFVINEMIGIFDKLYDLKSTGGPIFEQYMRNAMLLLMGNKTDKATLMEIPRVLSDPDFRQEKLALCDDPTVVDFWVNEAERAGGDAALANIVPYITSKLTSFISNDMMRPIIGQENSAFNVRDIMDEKKILLVSLPKGLVGEMNAYLLGMIMVGKVLMAALSRADSPQASRNPFYLYIDEFQNFTTDSIMQILSEARKYGLGLTLAHQYIGQLVRKGDTGVKDAVFGNVGTTIAFKTGPEDADFLEKTFKPQFSASDLMNVDKYTAFVRLLVDNMSTRPFTLRAPWPLFGKPDKGVAEQIRAHSRLFYGSDRELIEAEIRSRLARF